MNSEDIKKLAREGHQLNELSGPAPVLPWLSRIGKALGSAYGAGKAALKAPQADDVEPVTSTSNTAPSTVSTSAPPVQATATGPTTTPEPKSAGLTPLADKKPQQTTPATSAPSTSLPHTAADNASDTKPLVVDVKKKAETSTPSKDQSFSQAFRAAREKAGGGNGRFTWKGKEYQTNVAGEKYIARNKQTPVKEETMSESWRIPTHSPHHAEIKKAGYELQHRDVKDHDKKDKHYDVDFEYKHKESGKKLTHNVYSRFGGAQEHSFHKDGKNHDNVKSALKEETMSEEKKNPLIEGFLKLQESQKTGNIFQDATELNEISKSKAVDAVLAAGKEAGGLGVKDKRKKLLALADKKIWGGAKVPATEETEETGEQIDEISVQLAGKYQQAADADERRAYLQNDPKREAKRKAGKKLAHAKIMGKAKVPAKLNDDVELSADELARLDEILDLIESNDPEEVTGQKHFKVPNRKPDHVVSLKGRGHGDEAEAHVYHGMGPEKKHSLVVTHKSTVPGMDHYAYDHKPSAAKIRKHWDNR